MTHFISSKIGRLRLLGFLEGLTLLMLIFIGMPLKYFFEYHDFTKILGPIHGGLFIVFVILSVSVSAEQNWSFLRTTSKLIIASFIPFGTFYVDHKILKPAHEE